MAVARVIGVSLLLAAAAACAPRSNTTAPQPLRSDRGPKATIHAFYSGGLAYRTVDVSFRTEQNAYAVVGHLGGDGVIRIVYPTTPTASGYMSARRVRTKAIQSRFDGAPAFYAMSRTPFRSTGAMLDSYDGLGHGFIFIVATRAPMDFSAASDGYDWDDIRVVDYLLTADPRQAVRELAEQLADGSDYTLKFANSLSTQAFVSHAAMAEDCAWLSGLGYGFASGFWGSWGWWGPRLMLGRSPLHSYAGLRQACHPSYAYSGAGYLRYRLFDLPWNRSDFMPRRRPAPDPAPPVTATLTRPTYRAPDDFTRRGVVRSALERPTSASSGIRSRRWGTDSYDNGFGSRPFGRPGGSSRANDSGIRNSTPRGFDSPRTSGGGGASAAPRAGPSAGPPASRPATRASSTSTSTTETRKQQ